MMIMKRRIPIAIPEKKMLIMIESIFPVTKKYILPQFSVCYIAYNI